MKKYFLVLLILFLSLMGVAQAEALTVPAGMVNEIVVGINAERAKLGLPILKLSPALSQAATAKATDMATNKYFSHTSLSGMGPKYWMTQAGYTPSWFAENLAFGRIGGQQFVANWMASPLHKKNILNGKYTEIGVGTAAGDYEPAGGETYFVSTLFAVPAGGGAATAETTDTDQSAEAATTTSASAETGETDDETKEEDDTTKNTDSTSTSEQTEATKPTNTNTDKPNTTKDEPATVVPKKPADKKPATDTLVDEGELASIEPGAGELLEEREKGLTTVEMEQQAKEKLQKEKLAEEAHAKLAAELQAAKEAKEKELNGKSAKKFFGLFSVPELFLASALFVLLLYILNVIFNPNALLAPTVKSKKNSSKIKSKAKIKKFD